MDWLTQFDRSRKSGRCAFVFTGNVGDAFPRLHPTSDDPVDASDSFAETLAAHGVSGTPLVWMYDISRGFTFPRGSDGEQRCRAFLPQPSRTADGDDIGRAINAGRAVAPLPSDPVVAFGVMRAVFAAAAAASPPVACIAILPDADAMVPSAGAALAVANGQTTLALTILRIVEDEVFRRAGHALCLAAPTVASLDERLRRPSGPIAATAVRKPDEAERRGFLERCCATNDTLVARRAAIVDAIAIAEGAERRRAEEELRSEQQRMEEHDARRDALLSEDRECGDLRLARIAAEEEVRRVEAEQKTTTRTQRRSIERQIEEMTRRLAEEPTLQVEPLSREVWERLVEGDLVRACRADGAFVDRAVFMTHTDGSRTLSSAEDPRDAQRAVRVIWNDTRHALDLMAGGGRLVPEANQTVTGYSRIPEARGTMERNLDKARRDLEQIDAEAPTSVGKARAALARAEKNLRDREAVCLAEWSVARARFDDRCKALERAVAHPDTPELDALRERLGAVTKQLATMTRREPFPVPVMGIDALSRATQGLAYRDLADVLRHAKAHGIPITAETVLAQRVEILHRAYGDLFEVVVPPYGFDGIAGYDALKEDLRAVRDAMVAGDIRRVPMGMLLIGPPGTGKTAVAVAFARECGILLLKVKNLRERWVGATEQNYERMAQALLDLGLVVVFRDEVDEEDAGRDSPQGDSGVSARGRRTWMEFLSDPRIRGRVLIISASNRPDRMDAALKRSGRTDEIRAMLMPDLAQYRLLFSVLARREGHPCAVSDFAPFAERAHAKWLSGADIENILRRAHEESRRRVLDTITDETLAWAIDDFRSTADRRQVALMTVCAIESTNSTRLLPSDWQEQLAKARAILRGEPSEPVIVPPESGQQVAFMVDPKMVDKGN